MFLKQAIEKQTAPVPIHLQGLEMIPGWNSSKK